MFFSISVPHDDLYHPLPKIFLSYKLPSAAIIFKAAFLSSGSIAGSSRIARGLNFQKPMASKARVADMMAYFS
jgi:hypothetical protein